MKEKIKVKLNKKEREKRNSAIGSAKIPVCDFLLTKTIQMKTVFSAAANCPADSTRPN